MSQKFLVPIVLAADPTANMEAATKQYVDSAAGGGAGTVQSFTFNSTTTEPPTGNQVRFNHATQASATKIWISQTTFDGLDVTVGLSRISTGWAIYLQDFDDSTAWITFNVTANGTDKGSYWEFNVTYRAGPGVPTQKIALQTITPASYGMPPGGADDQVLTKTSSADYAVAWETPTGGGTTILDGSGPPSGATGVAGNYYEDKTNGVLYGPKSATGYGAAQIPVMSHAPGGEVNWECGARFRFTKAGRITGFRYKRITTNTATITFNLWNDDTAGVLLGTVNDTRAGVAGTFDVMLGTPVDVPANGLRTVAYYAAAVPYDNFGSGTIANTADIQFVEYRSKTASPPGYPTNQATFQVFYVTPIFEPSESWPVAVAVPTKTSLGLGNVDNTSDATKNAANVVLTSKTMSGVNNTFTNMAGTAFNNDTIANQKLAYVTAPVIKGRTTAGSGALEDLTPTQTTAMLNNFTTALKGLVPAPGTATGKFLKDDATWAAAAGGGAAVEEVTQAEYDALAPPDPDTIYVITDGADRTLLTGTGAPTSGDGINGDFWINTTAWLIYGPKAAGAWPTGVSIIGPAGPEGDPGSPGTPGVGIPTGGGPSQVLTKNSPTDYDVSWLDGPLSNNAVNNSMLNDMPEFRIKGRMGGTGDPTDLTAAQVTSILPPFTSADQGVAPASGGGTTNFLRADGTWNPPPAGGGGLPTTGGTMTGPINMSNQLITNLALPASANDAVSKTYFDTNAISVDGDVMNGALGMSTNVIYGLANGTSADHAVNKLQLDTKANAANTLTGTAPVRIDGGASADISANRTISIANDGVTNTHLATMPTLTIKGNATGSTAGPTDLTQYEARGLLRRPVINDTATTFAPVVATHENTFVTLSNASAITVTLPSNATSAFAIGAEIDFLWLGVGQPTFAAGGGATLQPSTTLSSALATAPLR